MNPYLVFILAVLILGYLLNLVSAILELRALDPELPREFQGYYDEQKYAQSQLYTRTTTRFSLVQECFMLPVIIGFILAGGFNRVDLAARSFGLGSIGTGLVFTAIPALLMLLINLPFSLYSTFVIEERFGFNRTTVKTYILDTLKSILLACCIGGPLLALIFWFFERTGSTAWLYCWTAVSLAVLLLQFLAPVVIMPLFNKFSPLEDSELKKRILAYINTQRFNARGIYTMDGSKRSTRLNAFFTGFGRFRRIVFFDTLLDKLDPGETVAVLAHEVGHFKKKHLFKMTAASILQTGIMFALLSLFLDNKQLFAAFGMEHVSVYAGLIFFGFLYAPISSLLGILFHALSRKHEFEADQWAAVTAGAEDMISALKKLSVHNLSNLTPHPVNVILSYSHPPVLQRIRAIEKLSKK
jgi:STE24 endopeptidase